jgi:hypothetical protein
MNKPSAKKRKRPPNVVYLRVAKLVDPRTGELVGAFVPLYACDRETVRSKKYHVGSELRADLKKPRNALFHRLAHYVGKLVAEQVDGFPSDFHEALKRLQRESGALCETQELDLGPVLGKVNVKVARSIAFDEMEEGEFADFFKLICDHIAEKYFTDMTPEAVADIINAMEGNQ